MSSPTPSAFSVALSLKEVPALLQHSWLTARRTIAPLLGATLLLTASCAKPTTTKAPEPKPDAPARASSDIGHLAEGEPHTAMPVEADDAVLGSPTAPVTLVAFLDFQCSFCKDGFSSLLELRDHYDDDELRIVFKHLPLEFHPLALPAAVSGQAVRGAGGSKAFFRFAELAFENQASLDYAGLAAWAEKAGVPRDLYNEAVGTKETVQRVAADMVLAQRAGVDGTPAFFINGRLLSGAQAKQAFISAIDEELLAMKALATNDGAAAPTDGSAASAPTASWAKRYASRVAQNMEGSVLRALLAEDPKDYKVPIDGSATWGPSDAPVTLVMFTDFECPYCKRADATLAQLKARYGGDIRVVVKHLPLHFHEHARSSARLAEAVRQAAGDAAFFEISDKLFASHPSLDRQVLLELGLEMGVEEEVLIAALDGRNAQIEDRLRRDSGLADDVEALGTPQFFVNGKRLKGARPLEQFEALVGDGKRRAEALIAKGTPKTEVYATLQRDALQPGRPTKLASVDVTTGQEILSSTGRPSRGTAKAPVTVHVFSDFECPYCRMAETTLATTEKLYPDKLRVVWHDLPLPFHEHARPAARAAREAYRQGGDDAFWKMHAALFGLGAKGTAVSPEEIAKHARSLNLNVDAIVSATTSDAQDSLIDEDAQMAKALGIRGTPAFVVNGYLIVGARPLRYFQRIVDLALEEATTAE